MTMILGRDSGGVLSDNTLANKEDNYLEINGTNPYSLNSDTSGNIIWTKGYHGSSSGGQITLSPYGTGSLTYDSRNCYATFELPKHKIPRRVYLCGRLVTLGALGTDVDCAFSGKKLIFEPGLINALTYNGRVTISLEYDDCTYHYNAGSQGIPAFKPNSRTLDSQLVSKIEHK